MSANVLTQETYLPDPEALEVDRVHSFLHPRPVAGGRTPSVQYVLANAASGDQVELPFVIYQVLRQVVDAMSQGLAVTVAPQSQTLTTQQGADLLGVSRPTFVKLLDADRIPSERVGTHRRVFLRDVLTYRQHRREEQYAALEATAISIDSEEDLESTLRDLKQARREVAAIQLRVAIDTSRLQM